MIIDKSIREENRIKNNQRSSARSNDFRLAAKDITSGFGLIRLSATLALEDIKDRFRRSYLGLTWIIISFLLFLVVKFVIFSRLNLSGDYDFTTHLAIGFTVWTYINISVSGSANLFVRFEGWILSSSLKYSVYMNILIIGALIEFILVLITAIIFCYLYGNPNLFGIIWIFPAIMMYYATAFALCMLLGPIGVFRRDVIYAIQTMLRALFFLTPIIWVAEEGTLLETIAYWNPFTYYIELVRVPLMSGLFPTDSWGICLAVTSALLVFGFYVFSRTKSEIAFWL